LGGVNLTAASPTKQAMQPSTASKTALTTSLMRALHTRADPLRIIDDPWGDRLVPDVARDAIRQGAVAAAAADQGTADDAGTDAWVESWLRGSVAYATVITRSRYAEDALSSAVSRGCAQYVLLGAGFDSYALRTPPECAHIDIYEVDHPATQSLKRQRIRECKLSVRDAVHFLAADLSTESLGSVLAKSNFDSKRPAFFSWLGVSMYLPREANLALLGSIAASAAVGSELVFTYVDQQAFEGGALATSAIARSVASIGEPFLSGFDPGALALDLHRVGFDLLEDLDDARVVERYDPRGLNGLKPAPHSRIAHARVNRESAAARSK
jgi:methyltransferase (TIGR00027 family)